MQTFLTAARKAREAIFWPTPVVTGGTFDSSEFSKQGVLITAESGIPKCRKWWLLGRSFFWVGHSLFLVYCKAYYFVEHLPMGVRNCQTTDRSADMNACWITKATILFQSSKRKHPPSSSTDFCHDRKRKYCRCAISPIRMPHVIFASLCACQSRDERLRHSCVCTCTDITWQSGLLPSF